MKNGELLEGDTLDQISPQQKKLEPLDFSDTDPAPVKTPTTEKPLKNEPGTVSEPKKYPVQFTGT